MDVIVGKLFYTRSQVQVWYDDKRLNVAPSETLISQDLW